MTLQCNVIPHWLGVYTEWSQVNLLGPSDATWRQRTESTLTQIMACCLTTPNHYLNQCPLIFKFLWHPYRKSEETNQYNKIENYIFKIASRSPRGQWVKCYSCAQIWLWRSRESDKVMPVHIFNAKLESSPLIIFIHNIGMQGILFF